MSADNYYVIRKHPLGGYAAVMGFASIPCSPPARESDKQFDDIDSALAFADGEYSEYGVSVHRECDGDPEYDEMAVLVRAWCTRVFDAPADDAYFAAYGIGSGLWSASPADYENEKPLNVIGRSVTDLVTDIVGSRERAVQMVHAYIERICLDVENLPSDLTIEVLDNNILFCGSDSDATRIFLQESPLLDTLCVMEDWARAS